MAADAPSQDNLFDLMDGVPADAPADAVERVNELRATLQRARDQYYLEDAPELPDAVYDSLNRELADLENRYPSLKTVDSPTQTVGGGVAEQFAPAQHQHRMYSLDDAMDLDELDEWLARTREAVGHSLSYCCELKIDGSSIALTYDRGTLVRAATRGDGSVGENVTANILQVKDVPRHLSIESGAMGFSQPIEVRGEVYMPRSSFERLNDAISLENDEIMLYNARSTPASARAASSPSRRASPIAATPRLVRFVRRTRQSRRSAIWPRSSTPSRRRRNSVSRASTSFWSGCERPASRSTPTSAWWIVRQQCTSFARTRSSIAATSITTSTASS